MNVHQLLGRHAWAPLAIAGLLCSGSAAAGAGDFTGDAKSDISVWRPSDGKWYILDSSTNVATGVQWGAPTDVPEPGDYDGDGKADIAVWRPSSGMWYIVNSSTNASIGVQWGMQGDVPVPGDYDGDGKTDIAVWRPSDGNWYVINSSTNQSWNVAWGWSADIPVPGDYDGDGKTDIALYRPSDGSWKGLYSSSWNWWSIQWGSPGDLSAPGDYDGDGKTDIAVWRPSNGTWYIINSTTNQGSSAQWGSSGDVPVPGDYNGDGITDFAVWRPSTGNWHVYNTPQAWSGIQWGSATDVPVVKGTAANVTRPGPRLAHKFAPHLHFDSAAPNFPMSAQQFRDNGSSGDTTDYGAIVSHAPPTYYQVISCGNQTRIMYWWFYGHQNTCDGVSGAHNGDWENVMVTLAEDQQSVAAVTYWLHGDHYTRLNARGGIEMENGTHPVVHPGKETHASYYNQGGSGSCLMWEDFHHDGGATMDSANNLVSLDNNSEPWMVADRQGGSAWGPDGVNTHPTTQGPSCYVQSASFGEAHWGAQCKPGDSDSGVECLQQCAHGYTDGGLICTNWSTWSSYTRNRYSYQYDIPTSNLGLTIEDY